MHLSFGRLARRSLVLTLGLLVAVSFATPRNAAAAHTPSALVPQTILTASDPANNMEFGHVVALSGTTAVVGVISNDNTFNAAYVYLKSGTTWSLQQKLTPDDGQPGDAFGQHVAIDGDTIVIGAAGKGVGTGAAYVFTRSGTTWTQAQRLDPQDNAGDYNFGESVAVNGNTIIVGAPHHNNGNGTAYVFANSGGTWSQTQELAPTGLPDGENFGQSVAMTGTTAIFGLEALNSFTGGGLVYSNSGGTWAQGQTLTVAGSAEMGASVAIDGSTIVLGAPITRNGSGDNVGAVYVFADSGGTWNNTIELTGSDSVVTENTSPSFGASVAVSGNTVLVGADAQIVNNTYVDAGEVYLFTISGATSTQQTPVAASDVQSGYLFGTAVALSKDTALVGAIGPNNFTGAVYVFGLKSGGTPPPPSGALAMQLRVDINNTDANQLTADLTLINHTGAQVPVNTPIVFTIKGLTFNPKSAENTVGNGATLTSIKSGKVSAKLDNNLDANASITLILHLTLTKAPGKTIVVKAFAPVTLGGKSITFSSNSLNSLSGDGSTQALTVKGPKKAGKSASITFTSIAFADNEPITVTGSPAGSFIAPPVTADKNGKVVIKTAKGGAASPGTYIVTITGSYSGFQTTGSITLS